MSRRDAVEAQRAKNRMDELCDRRGLVAHSKAIYKAEEQRLAEIKLRVGATDMEFLLAMMKDTQ